MDAGLLGTCKASKGPPMGSCKASRGPHPKWMRAFWGHVGPQDTSREAMTLLQIALLGPWKASRGTLPKWMRAF
eukprot:6288533-Karenia_brevis.AAC.1